jgi:hypothetical protein
MKNNKSIQLLTLALFILWLGMVGGCGGGSSSNSGGGAGSQNVESHGQVTINLLEHNVFTGDKLNENFWGWLEAYCKAGPTQLIIADMPLVFEHFNRSIAPGFGSYRPLSWPPLIEGSAGVP